MKNVLESHHVFLALENIETDLACESPILKKIAWRVGYGLKKATDIAAKIIDWN